MSKQHDDAVDKVLAALKNASPPEGMEARIAQRLAQPAQANASRWRNVFAESTPTAMWWRGAISGAAVAMLATGAVLFAAHLLRPQSTLHGNAPIATRQATVEPANASIHATHTSEPLGKPCATPTVLRVHNVAPALNYKALLAESLAENAAPSRPAPAMPLTVEERRLAQLARTADPKQLASLTLEAQAKLEAEDAAEFARFFAPRHPPLVQDTHPEPVPEAAPETNPEISPKANE